MGGVSWAAHNELEDKNKRQKVRIDDLEHQYNELKKRYEEREREIQIQQEHKEKEENDIQRKKQIVIEDMNNTLKIKQDEKLLNIEKKFDDFSQTWCKDEIEDIDFKKILKDCCKQLIECKGENIENNIKNNV